MRLFCALVLLVGGVTAQGVLKVGSFTNPSTFDPHITSHQGHFLYFAQLYETPLECGVDASGHVAIRPGISEMPAFSKDLLTLTLTVRGVSWFQDDACFKGGKGRPVTAEDLAFTFMRHANPSYKSAYWPQFLKGFIKGLDEWRARCESEKLVDYDLAGVEGLSVDGNKLTIKLTQRYPQLPALLTQPWASVIAREAVETYGSSFGESKPVGSGPFVFVRKDALNTVHMKRNPNYRIKGKPGADELRLIHLTSWEQQIKRFIAGNLSFIEVAPGNEEEFTTRSGRVKLSWKRKGCKLIKGVSLDVSYLCFNCNNKFLKHPSIRRAVALCIDRKAKVSKVWGLRGTVANSPIPAGFREVSLNQDDAYDLRKRNVARARRLLEEAGHKDGKGLPEFIFDAPNAHLDEGSDEVVKRIISDLESAGIKAQFRKGDFPTFADRSRRGDFQIAWLSWYADYPDVENFLTLFRSGATLDLHGFNYGSYSNAEFDKLYDEMCTILPGPRRDELVKRMVEIVRTDCPWVFLAHGRQIFLVQRGVSGLTHHLLNFCLKDVMLKARSSGG